MILRDVLANWLLANNAIRYRGSERQFSDANVDAAIRALEEVPYDGLVRANEVVYDLLRLGKSLTQVVDGDTKSFPLRYVDWEHPERNVFHVTDELAVERRGSAETLRPDVVLYVNGIPFAVIECKRPDLDDPIGEAISQQIRNQKDDGIPRLFILAQLLLVVSRTEARYATTGTPREFWASWREEALDEVALRALVNRPLASDDRRRLFASRPPAVREHFDALEAEGGREPTEQDRALWALCRPERLLELTEGFTVFDGAERKVARYQQYFCVKKTMARLRGRDAEGRRQGGIVWHTQGSGKSLTMVMLAAAIAREE